MPHLESSRAIPIRHAELIDYGLPRSTIGYLVEWEDRFAFIDAVFGKQSDPNQLATPLQHREIPAYYAESVELYPVGPPIPGRFPTWQYAKVFVRFARPIGTENKPYEPML